MVVKKADKCRVLQFVEYFDLLRYRYKRNGRCEVGVGRTLTRGTNSWFTEPHICRSKIVTMNNHCEWLVSHVYSGELVMVAGNGEESEWVGKGGQEEGVLKTKCRRRIGKSLQSDDESMRKVLLDKLQL